MNKRTISTITISILCGLSTAVAGQITGPVVNPANGHSYYLLTQNNWTGAEAEAISLGGHLTTINDLTENQWVFDTFASFGGVDRFLWLGLYDVSGAFDWQWADSEPAGYFNWAPNEPNNNPGDEHWVYMYANNSQNQSGNGRVPGKWNNYLDLNVEFNATPLFAVAEINPNAPTPEPATFILLGVASILLGAFTRFRQSKRDMIDQ